MLGKVRSKTESIVRKAADSDDPILIESPPASGKTWNAVQLAANTEHKVTYLAGRVDLYEQAKTIAREDTSLTVETIPSPHRDCPTFQGENDGDTDRVHQLYQKGIRARDLHFEGWDKVYTPCQYPDDPCPYIQSLERLRPNSSVGNTSINKIDLLIGNHQHAYRESYLEDRIVIFDEFNSDPFIQRYPSPDETVDIRDAPSEIIGQFLETIENFPFDDISDIIESRGTDSSEVEEAIEWFKQYGASARHGKEIMAPSTSRYDASHTAAPLLTLGVLLGEKVGPGIELAQDDNTWEATDVDTGTRCLRDRNTNDMIVLNPPPVDSARQVIGMDALPTKRLWDTVFGTTFNLRQVLDRETLDRYLTEGLNFRLFQIGDGNHHYSGGNVSQRDSAKFEAIRLMEGERFPLISRKKAIEHYQNQPWFSSCIKPTSEIDTTEESSESEPPYAGQHYATVLSSNRFAKEELGVVSGSPYPSDDVVKRWAGLCGEATEPIRSDKLEDFTGFGHQVYRHFTHNQVFQAILRFGRDVSGENSEVRVYINTHAVPRWLNSIETVNIKNRKSEPKRVVVLEELIRCKRGEDLSQQTVSTLRQKVSETLNSGLKENDNYVISDTHIRETLQSEEFEEVVSIEEDGGAGGADLYEWVGSEQISDCDRPEDVDSFLELDKVGYYLKLEGDRCV
jgi:hypothetical protein